MSLSTRRPAGIPGSVRPPRSAATTRDWEPTSRTRGDSPPSFGSTGNKYRTSSQSQRSHSAPRQESDDLPRSRHTKEASPLPSAPSRHSAQSSVSSSSSRSSALSAASTAPSSIWDYVGWKTNVSVSESEQVETSSPEPVEFRSDPSTLWSRVAAVAGGLSVNVGKVWETKDELPEPDTPPGCDSRVTTALKKHYLKQVNDPRQLPVWLFSDIERQVGQSRSRTEPASGDQDEESYLSPTDMEPAPTPVRSRARHGDTYGSQSTTGRERSTSDEFSTRPTRAATRLRALRDARRGPVESMEREAYAPRASEPESEPVIAAPLPRLRVGLPSGPRSVRRE